MKLKKEILEENVNIVQKVDLNLPELNKKTGKPEKIKLPKLNKQ